MTSVADLASDVEGIVRGWWTANQAPVLLSKLGSLLSENSQVLIRIEKLPLKRFIQDVLADRLRLVSLPRHGGGVAPLEETRGLSDDQLSEAFESQRRRQISNRIPRYNALIWDAFRTPLTEGRRRFVRVGLQGQIEVREIANEDDALEGDGWIEVHQDNLPLSDGGPPSIREMDDAIRHWADGKIDTRRLLHVSTAPSAGQVAQRPRPPMATLDSVIVGLRVFTTEELARIQIPADVVLSLLERNRRGQ